MKIQVIPVGELQCNCYLVVKGDHVLVIDPGDDAFKIKKEIGERQVDGILITHHHFDHVGALDELQGFYHADVYDYPVLEEKEYVVGSFAFEVIVTLGHTEDSVTFYFKDDDVMFTGDFLFYQSVGRTDLPGGDGQEMMKSLNKIKKYPDHTTIYPGHGPSSTLHFEKEYNYFLKGCK